MQFHGEHQSLWVATGRQAGFESLAGDMQFDVAIIGAGITGLTAALLLAREGRKVAVLEAREIGSGTSGRTTAHATAHLDAGYAQIEKTFGRDGAGLVANSMMSAIDRIEKFVRESSIDCSFERIPAYYYAESENDRDIIEKEYESARVAGLRAELVYQIPLPFKTALGISIADQAQFHALNYLVGLADAVTQFGGRIYTGTRVTEVADGQPCTVRTERGKVTARDVIMATHTPIGKSILHTALPPYQSYVMAVKLNGPAPHGLFWDTGDPYTYIRNLSLPQGEVVLIGGKDNKTAHGSEEESYRALEAYIRERFDVAEFLYAWSAEYFESPDGLPFIGKVPSEQHTYVSTGYLGDGITFGTLGGMMTSDAILGYPNPYADLYKTTRVKAEGLGKWVSENLDNAKRMVADRVTSGDADDIDKIPAGEGRVLRLGGDQVAAYRDGTGALHTFSAVCPHMKCIVRWNSAEKTYDCPCHGSRFSVDGKALEGPALTGLDPIQIKGVTAAR